MAIWLVLGLAGTPARGETLADAVALSYESNPQLLAQRAQLRAIQESYNQALANYGPSASLQLSRTGTHFDLAGSSVEETTDTNQLSLNQPLYSGGAAHATLNLAKAQAAAGLENQLQAGQQILQAVISAYAAVRRDETGEEIARENVAVLEQQLSDTEAKFALYEVTITDKSQAEARLAAARAQLSARQGQLAQSRDDYLAVVGQNPGDLSALPPVPHLPDTIDAAFDHAERHNHALRVAVFTEQQSLARLEQTRAQNRPTVGLEIQTAETPLSSFSPSSTTRVNTAGLVLRQTLPITGLIRSRIIAAEEQNRRDQLLIDDARRQAIRSVSQAWTQLATARASLSARRQQVTANQIAFESVKEEQRLGLRTILDVLNAEQELRDAKFGLVETAYQEYVSSTALLSAMGELRFADFAPGLTEQDVRPRRALQVPWAGLLDGLDSIGVRDPAPIDKTLAERARTPDRSLPLPAAQASGP